MFNNKVFEFLVHYEIPKLGIKSHIIVEARSTGVAQENLQNYLNEKHSQIVKFEITSMEEIGVKEAAS